MHETACRVTESATGGVGSSFHCVPSHCSTRPPLLEPPCRPPTTMQKVELTQEASEKVAVPGPVGKRSEIVGGAQP